jgi:hypothetical protein
MSWIKKQYGSFFFRAETLVDNAKLKSPEWALILRLWPARWRFFSSRRQRKKSLSMPEQASAITPSAISTR